MATALPIVAGVVSLYGAYSSNKAGKEQAAATKEQAQKNQEAANFEAAQHDYLAIQEVAAAQREAIDERRAATLLASKAKAAAGASGGGVSDPTVEDIINKITGEGAYRAALAMYKGEEAARTHRANAQSLRQTGQALSAAATQEAKAFETAGRVSAASTILSGASTIMNYYGK